MALPDTNRAALVVRIVQVPGILALHGRATTIGEPSLGHNAGERFGNFPIRAGQVALTGNGPDFHDRGVEAGGVIGTIAAAMVDEGLILTGNLNGKLHR